MIFEPLRAVGRQGVQVVGFRGQDQPLEHLPLREVVELAEPGEGGASVGGDVEVQPVILPPPLSIGLLSFCRCPRH